MKKNSGSIVKKLLIVLCAAGLSGCLSNSRFLANDYIDKIVTRQPLPRQPDTACYALPLFRTVSLKELQETARVQLKAGGLSDSIKNLCGLKTIEGFVIDHKNKDILLIGRCDAALPPLLLDDFIVAMRSAWKKYVVNDTFSSPGCSIDPVPAALEKIDGIFSRIRATRSPEHWKDFRQEYEQACAEPQTVRVLGIPFDSHFASVLVAADYAMKRMVDGSDSIDIPGFADYYALSSYQARQAMHAKKKVASRQTLNRFWFNPARYHFREQAGMTALDACDLCLLTEAEFLSASRQIVGTGSADPLADTVAASLTKYLPLIAQKRPIYRQLMELMRMYVVAEAMYRKNADAASGLRCEYLLTLYEIPPYPVTKSLPGIAQYRQENYTETTMDGTCKTSFIFPICGGVAFTVRLDEQHFSDDASPMFGAVKTRIIDQKPAAHTLFWDVRPGA